MRGQTGASSHAVGLGHTAWLQRRAAVLTAHCPTSAQAGVGSVLGGWVADRLGRKAALLLADVLFAAGSAAMAAAQEHWALIAGGWGIGNQVAELSALWFPPSS